MNIGRLTDDEKAALGHTLMWTAAIFLVLGMIAGCVAGLIIGGLIN